MYITKVRISNEPLPHGRYRKAWLAIYLDEQEKMRIAHISIHVCKSHALIYKQAKYPTDPKHPVEPKYIFIKVQLEKAFHEQVRKSDAGIPYTGEAHILNKIREKKIKRFATAA